MSILGSIFPCENAQSYAETVHHVSELLYPDNYKEIEASLLQRIDLFKQYFIMIGGFTHAATRTLIAFKKETKPAWQALTFQVFPANEMGPKAQLFWESPRRKEAWLVSEWLVATQSVRAHHESFFVEKKDGAIKITTLDRRANLEGIRGHLLSAFLPFGVPLHIYISTQKRQHDWSQCPILTLKDTHRLYTSNTTEFYSFIENTSTSIEVDVNQKWIIYSSPYAPPEFMGLVQSVSDLIKYETLVVSTGLVSKKDYESVKAKIRQKNPQWQGGELQPLELSLRITHLYIKYGRIMVSRILNDEPPIRQLSPSGEGFPKRLRSKL